MTSKYLTRKYPLRKYDLRVPVEKRDHLDEIAAQWRNERPDLDVAPLELLGRLFRTAQLADAELSRGIAPHDLHPGWFDLLAALRRSGEPYELNPTQLMRSTMLSSGGMTKRVDRLAEADLVERRPDPSDRRGTLVALTAKGKRVVDEALVTHLANEERLLRSLSKTQRQALDDLLRSLLADLEG
jgi:DNA-binding MarR family transcriptional regulator